MLNIKEGSVIASKYKVIKKIGSGGNGTVYKVVSLNNENNFLALKIVNLDYDKYYNKRYSHYRKNGRKKYARFCREIKVVQKYQDEIKGILPIYDLYVPKHPSEENFPWYVMPIAEEMNEKLKNCSFEQKIESIFEIAKTLRELHSEGIAHRDIKPQNIYFYQNRWVLSDFGLVSYPNNERLTGTKEAIGPKKPNTIAPEMREDSKNANPFCADIYSLAKTLWLILTNKDIAFGGQYNCKNEVVSLGTYIKGEYLITLHEILTMCTSDIPEDRPTAEQLVYLFKEWFDIKNDFRKRCRKEWDFIIKEITPYTPETIVWSNIQEIVKVLDLVSQTNSYNHMFLPSGGGRDLYGCELSRKQGFIELNLNMYIMLVKPKRLYMEILGDYQWNYFLLETEQIPPCGLYEYGNTDDIYEERVLEVEPDVYIEPYHLNYRTYNGKELPDNAREICIGLKGNYVIFPKDSYYNLSINSYNAFQTKYETPLKFKNFIKKIIEFLRWKEINPEKYNELIEKRKEKEEKEKQEWISLNSKEEKQLLNHIQKFKLLFENDHNERDKNAEFEYTLSMQIVPSFELYLNNEGILIVKEDLWDFENKRDFYKFYNFEKAKRCATKVKMYLDIALKNLHTISSNEINCYINMKRLKRPKHLFTKEEIIEVLRRGNDNYYNRLVINKDGYIELVQPKEIEYLEIFKYPVLGYEFPVKNNMVGEMAPINDYIEDVYMLMLDAWYEHLRCGENVCISDYVSLSEKELLNGINYELNKYSL
jgi:serine/threonine protein kinase